MKTPLKLIIVLLSIICTSSVYAKDIEEIYKEEALVLLEYYDLNSSGTKFTQRYLKRMAEAIVNCEFKKTCEIVKLSSTLVIADKSGSFKSTDFIKQAKLEKIAATALLTDFEHSANSLECINIVALEAGLKPINLEELDPDPTLGQPSATTTVTPVVNTPTVVSVEEPVVEESPAVVSVALTTEAEEGSPVGSF